MNTGFRFETPRFNNFLKHPLKPFADTNFSLFDNFFDGAFDLPRTSLPYNTILNEDGSYTIQVALAGFDKDDFEVTLSDTLLRVSSKAQGASSSEEDESEPHGGKITYPYYLHKGIAKRDFSLRFTIPTGSKVSDPIYKDGLLTINVQKVEPQTGETKRLKIKS